MTTLAPDYFVESQIEHDLVPAAAWAAILAAIVYGGCPCVERQNGGSGGD